MAHAHVPAYGKGLGSVPALSAVIVVEYAGIVSVCRKNGMPNVNWYGVAGETPMLTVTVPRFIPKAVGGVLGSLSKSAPSQTTLTLLVVRPLISGAPLTAQVLGSVMLASP
jgi:hypothetical protein